MEESFPKTLYTYLIVPNLNQFVYSDNTSVVTLYLKVSLAQKAWFRVVGGKVITYEEN